MRRAFMQRPLPKCAGILAMFLAVPILCLAWTDEPSPELREFDDEPGLSDSLQNRGGALSRNGSETAVNIPIYAQKPPAVSKPLYQPNVARDRKDSRTAGTGLAGLLSFLLPTKDDLERCFKGEDDGFRDGGRPPSDPFKRRDRK
jgi:hypothetical protein